MSTIVRRWGLPVLAAMLFGPLFLVMALEPIPQDQAYHAFADRRAIFGIPNFANVVSNLPFLVVGIFGLCLSRRQPSAFASWTVFFLGVSMVAFGSAYYHWTPNDQTLVWDRLPMTVAFMGLFIAVLSEHLSPAIEPWGLPAALAAGIGSLGWWVCADDLRLYSWIQLAPLLAIVATSLLFPARYTHGRYLLVAFALYLLAKAMEYFDAAVYALTDDILGGHALKHVLAAGAPLWLYFMLRDRSPARPAAPSG